MLISPRLAALTLFSLTLLPYTFAATILYRRYGKPRVIRTFADEMRSEQACNGHPALCNRKYGNTTFLGAHDSFAVSSNPLACEFVGRRVIPKRNDFTGFSVPDAGSGP